MLLIIIICYSIPLLYHPKKLNLQNDPLLQKQLDALLQSDSAADNTSFTKIDKPIVLFAFNPNTIDSLGWERLGLKAKTIHTLLNYRNKGGRFKDAESIRKIWGLKKEDADRLIPFISIANTQSNKYPYKDWTNKKETTSPSVVDINTVQADELRLLLGLEYPLPYKISSYRERLGGFLHIEQIKEVQGMNDSIFQSINKYLMIGKAPIKKININTATDNELSSHPYISRNVAKAIIIYREQHGNYMQVEDIKKIVFIKDALYNKIAPYLSVND